MGYDPCTIMFFFRNKHIMIDLGTGNNNKINWAMEDKQELIDIVETVFRSEKRKGFGCLAQRLLYQIQILKIYQDSYFNNNLLFVISSVNLFAYCIVQSLLLPLSDL